MMICSSNQSLPTFLLAQNVKPYRYDDDKSLDDELIKSGHFQQAHAIVEHTNDKRANNRANDSTHTTGKTRAANNNGRNRIQFKHVT